MPFKMNYHTTSERLKDILYKSSDYDSVPFSNTTNHRFRDLASSFNTKPIRYTPSCSIAKVYETLDSKMTNEVPYYENKKMEKILKSTKISM